MLVDGVLHVMHPPPRGRRADVVIRVAAHQTRVLALLLPVQGRPAEGLHQEAMLVVDGLRPGRRGEDAEEPRVGPVREHAVVEARREGAEAVVAPDALAQRRGEGRGREEGLLVRDAGELRASCSEVIFRHVTTNRCLLVTLWVGGRYYRFLAVGLSTWAF